MMLVTILGFFSTCIVYCLAAANSDFEAFDKFIEEDEEEVAKPKVTHHARWHASEDPEWEICQP
ncbi:hypothetical protein O3M35_008326 [Rhynocoris fuscipes]|uniref:Uncharacterized protein n=1 Tax=Rhynocoris fuscipes TaxID=488301 RepID=A0AAW1D874_9HEMI